MRADDVMSAFNGNGNEPPDDAIVVLVAKYLAMSREDFVGAMKADLYDRRDVIFSDVKRLVTALNSKASP